jgi:hypothetical protein
MSSNLKSPPEGLKASKCKKGKSGVQPPIPYVPLTDLIKKWEGEQIKVKMPDGTNFSMSTFMRGTNKDYLVHVIVVLRIIVKKGTAAKSRRPRWRSLPSGRKWRLFSNNRPTSPKKPRSFASLPWNSSRASSRQRKALQLQ